MKKETKKDNNMCQVEIDFGSSRLYFERGDGDFTQAGLGGKYQLFPQLQVEASYTNFIMGNTQGAGATFNIGVRYISK